jgi:proteasome beta subunit
VIVFSLNENDGCSFYDLLMKQSPELLPRNRMGDHPGPEWKGEIPEGTTVLALKYNEGAIVAGDRMAVEGYHVSDRRIEKVYNVDDSTVLAIAGAAGPCLELVKLFKTELEHYEKIEGVSLSLEGKANKLSQMIKANFPMAAQGLVVIPLFIGYQYSTEEGKIYKYDVTGGRYEEIDYHAVGSGGRDAKNTLKKVYRDGLPEVEAIQYSLEALYDASEEDLGTGGPDFMRGIFPTVKVLSSSGIVDVPEKQVRELYSTIFQGKGCEK